MQSLELLALLAHYHTLFEEKSYQIKLKQEKELGCDNLSLTGETGANRFLFDTKFNIRHQLCQNLNG